MSHSPPMPLADSGQRLSDVVAHAGHLLPAQGPIGVFVHHNTLHAFQHLPFHEALSTASATFETAAYLPEARYRELYRRGRITDGDLKAVLAERDAEGTPVELAPVQLSGLELELLALLHPLPVETAASLRWRMSELSASYCLRSDVPREARQRLLKRSTEGLRRWMDRVGRDWTMTDLAVALLDPSLEATLRASAAEPARAMPVEAALRRLGLPETLTASYVEQVKKRLPGATGLTVEGWLGAEATLVLDALASAFGGNGGWSSLRERLERQPESFAVSALWAACRDPVLSAKTGAEEKPRPGEERTHREELRAATGEDINDLVNPQLIRACSAFLDEGVSHWNMPDREHGLYAAWSAMKRTGLGLLPDWLEGLKEELR
ncbi:MAG TPA: putative inorganic carbon transporter subunit DabA, partial [Myxococcaceae bacterium]|nr:putative inorganic carbon transporter subunit DabA [Myxococcaceae bacterium]